MWIDLEDLSLAPEDRRSEDVFTGADGSVCEQLLLDAPRELFVVDGVEFDFAKESRHLAADVDGNSLEELKARFSVPGRR